MEKHSIFKRFGSIAARSGILLFFIMAFEVMIMISPFAFFFYSVFNPVLHQLGSHPSTAWLTAFFLPHMILPPTLFLKTIRVLGSCLFIVGSLTFVVCAAQVYLGKIFKWGIAEKGLYRIIRHPQYLALGLWGFGMAILWPRFLVLATLAVMLVLYYFLAKDEEHRMLGQFGEGYQRYMERTGMFFPRAVEAWLLLPLRFIQHPAWRSAAVVFGVPIMVVGSGFLLRAITLHSLPYNASHQVTLVSILPEDKDASRKALEQICKADWRTNVPFLEEGKDYLGYVMPADYIMQGMIADTGGDSHLHKQNHTFALIGDWVLNPFEHLRRPPSAMMAKMHNVDPAMARRHHCPLGVDDPSLSCDTCPYRRIIFLEIDHSDAEHRSKADVFAFDVTRVPVGFIDINVSTGAIATMKKVGKATAWRDVPTPSI